MPTATIVSGNEKALKIPYTPATAKTAGDVVVLGELVGIVEGDLAASQLGSLIVGNCVVRVPKSTASSSAITSGAKCYWDAGNSVATTTAGSNKTLGSAVDPAGDPTTAAAADEATVDIALGRY
jgi:predicted RecA/RadA family phage recombinase